jgi:hypothetical protein
LTAEEFELLSAHEAEAILAERYTRLTEAGYPPTSALLAATRLEIDVDLAAQLLSERPQTTSVCVLFRGDHAGRLAIDRSVNY